MKSEPVIVLTDVESRKSFDVFNCLRKTHNFILFSKQHWLVRVFLMIVYFRKVHYLGKNGEEVIFAFSENSPPMPLRMIYLPIDEITTRIVIENLDQILHIIPNFRTMLPSLESFDICGNKLQFAKYCHRNSFQIPVTVFLNEDLVVDDLIYPLIAKPVVGSGSVGIPYIDNPGQFPDEILGLADEWLVQSRLAETREVYGAFFLMENGACVSYYGHKRLRTFPSSGGVSTFSVTSSDEQLKVKGVDILSSLNWNGLAMVEFIFDDKADDFKIIEINPRIWGSILLSQFSGNNLLENFISRCLGKEIDCVVSPKRAFLRWILPYEVMFLLKGEISFAEFFRKESSPVCYINISFANPFSSFAFHCFMLFFKFSRIKLI